MSSYIDVFKRTEIKYILSENQFRKLFQYLESFARVDAYGKTRINNIYFDTPDYRMIRISLDKPVYKEKLRLRTYGSTTDDTNSFIEIKKKYDGVVYKRRVSGAYKDAYAYLVNGAAPLDDSQISREIMGLINTYNGIRPAMRICYDRIAMAGIYDPEFRVTFDKNIDWSVKELDLRKNVAGSRILADDQYMMEIKVKDAMPIGLAEMLSKLKIFPASFSKYGRGYEAMIKQKERPCIEKNIDIQELKKGVKVYA